MNVISRVIAILGLAGMSGGVMAYFARSRGRETIELLNMNIAAYKNSETLKDAEIAYLKGQLVTKERTIERLLK